MRITQSKPALTLFIIHYQCVFLPDEGNTAGSEWIAAGREPATGFSMDLVIVKVGSEHSA